MALPDSVKRVDGTSFIFAFDSEWPASPTQGWSATVDAEIDLGGLAADAYWQSAKCNLTANRDVEYKVEVSIEPETDPASGGTVEVYAGFSDSVTAGTGNPAELSGADATYVGGTSGTAAVGVQQLTHIGSLTLQVNNDADAEPNVGVIGVVVPTGQYMMIVVHNNSSVAFTATADEAAVRVTGMTIQTQD